MLNPNVDPFFRHVVRIQHQELLQKIEADRLYHQLTRHRPGLGQRIGQQIKATGQWLKAQTRSRSKTAEPCFDES